MSEQAVSEARKIWNTLGQEHRRIIVRWCALAINLRRLFCQIVCDDGNCPKEKQ